MKTNKLTIYTLSFLLSLIFIGCSDDDDNNGKDYKNYPYSKLSVEEQKKKLNTDALEFISQMEGLIDSEGLKIMNRFAELCEISEPDLDNTTNTGAVIYINDFYGKYTWNFSEEDWTVSESSDKLVFEFPADRKSTQNNATIEVTGVASITNYEGVQLPKKLDAVIYSGTNNVGSIAVAADIKGTNTVPGSANVKIVLGEYTITMDAEKGSTNTAKAKISKGSVVLSEGNANLQANLDELLINDKDSSVKGGTAEVKLLDNLVAYGNIDFAQWASEIEKIEKEYWNSDYEEEDEKMYAEKMSESFNKNSTFILASRDDKTKIADIIMRVKEETYSHTYWDWEKEEDVEVVYRYYYGVYAFRFNDNTVVDAEVFFSSGFDAVVKKFNDFLSRF